MSGVVRSTFVLLSAACLAACGHLLSIDDADGTVDGGVVDLSALATPDSSVPIADAGFSGVGPPTEDATVVGPDAGDASSLPVPGGRFRMGRSASGSDMSAAGNGNELPDHDVDVSSFQLDRREVTVARFRAFVATYAGHPVPGVGAHPKIPGSGWLPAWDSKLPSTSSDLRAALSCVPPPSGTTWSTSPGDLEDHPITCVSWYEAFAFCAWDGGRLPTEAEWEYAAAGGDQDRLYPWGQASPSSTLAAYSFAPISSVGSRPTGAGRFGHEDLAGNVWEWTLDAYDPSYVVPCVDCARLSGPTRVFKGGAWNSVAGELRPTWRDGRDPAARSDTFGFRCAR